MKTFTSSSQKLGELGEELACRYLVDRSFSIIDRNYTKKWGEIDIIAKRKGITHFIEVKSVSCESNGGLRPEDHMTRSKVGRLRRIISTYLIRHPNLVWQFDLICVSIARADKKAYISKMENLII